MAQQVYPPNIIVKVVLDSFFKYRQLTQAPRGLAQDGIVPDFDDDRIINSMGQIHYIRIDALRSVPRGGRKWVVVLILSADGKYSQHAPDLRKLLEGIHTERPVKDNLLDEIIIIAEPQFFTKKTLLEEIYSYQDRKNVGPDHEGQRAFYNVYPYYNFAFTVPEHKSVPQHVIMTQEEVDSMLQMEHITRSDLPIIFHNDPPIVWNGGREGQVVKIMRESETAGVAVCYRRIERGPQGKK